MTKAQRKILIALLGLIAAVAAAIGGGWAVHVFLSNQNNSITATDGGVVNQDIQGSPVTHTGTGDINQGIQHQGIGDIGQAVQQEGKGNTQIIHIGIPFEKYKADLKEREQEVTERLEQIHAKESQIQEKERQILKKEKAEIERQLADAEASYQNHIKELKERIAQLETIRGQIPDALLDQARTALAQGDRRQADQLFTQIKARTKAAIQVAAEADYQLSRIALDEIRYRKAYEHAQRAAQLAPENGLYLTGAGELARILGDYRAAKDYSEQALASDLSAYGEDHPHVAASRNNLGMAWEALGEYRKAIGYYEQALASDLNSYGEDHPRIATIRNNLGLA
ncbi:tetratricopeptide repeat protein, partial [Candidatus Thiosymbion oneisti]